MTLLLDLPNDVLLVVLGYLESFDLCRVAQTNSVLRLLSNTSTLWKRLYLSTLPHGTLEQSDVKQEQNWKTRYFVDSIPLWKPLLCPKSKRRLLSNIHSSQTTPTVSTVLLSDGAVGKTRIVQRFLHSVFHNRNDPTIEEIFQKDVNIFHNTPVSIEIADTSGIEVYRYMKEYYIKKCEGFIFLYSITNKKSFEAIPKLVSMVRTLKRNADIPMVLVGTKSDLHSQRQISVLTGKKLAQELNCPFFEVSAVRDDLIQEMFAEISLQILLRRKFKKSAKKQPQGIEAYAQVPNSKKKLKNKCAVM